MNGTIELVTVPSDGQTTYATRAFDFCVIKNDFAGWTVIAMDGEARVIDAEVATLKNARELIASRREAVSLA